jgi:hypothetical protein
LLHHLQLQQLGQQVLQVVLMQKTKLRQFP